jgi:hypothetical protein
MQVLAIKAKLQGVLYWVDLTMNHQDPELGQFINICLGVHIVGTAISGFG